MQALIIFADMAAVAAGLFVIGLAVIGLFAVVCVVFGGSHKNGGRNSGGA